MKPVLVTGASGFLGWHVARLLCQRGERVRALVRPQSIVPELAVETITGDLRDPRSVAEAIAGCRAVYHVAADYRLWVRDPANMYATNVTGTRNLLAAAEQADVDRVVYTSTVGCIGMPRDCLGDETTPVSLSQMQGHYKRSKFLAEQVAMDYASRGLRVVIVNPTAPVGDHDFRPTPTGKIVVDFLRGAMPAYVNTGLNVVDARDVAHGHLLACELGRTGERYILGGENLTLKAILETLARIAGSKAPTAQLPYSVAYLAGLASTGWARMSGGEPRVPLDGVRMARKKMWVTHAKATSELGYTAQPAEQALARAVEWFQTAGERRHEAAAIP